MKNLNFGIYCVYDSKSEEYGVPFVSPNDVLAKRTICTELMGTSDVIIKDLSLVEIAQYNTDTAVIQPYVDPNGATNYVCVALGDELLSEVLDYREIINKARKEVEKENKA